MSKNVVLSRSTDYQTWFECQKCDACFSIHRDALVNWCPECGIKFDLFAIDHRKHRRCPHDKIKPPLMSIIQIVQRQNHPGYADTYPLATIYVYGIKDRLKVLVELKQLRKWSQDGYGDKAKVLLTAYASSNTNT